MRREDQPYNVAITWRSVGTLKIEAENGEERNKEAKERASTSILDMDCHLLVSKR